MDLFFNGVLHTDVTRKELQELKDRIETKLNTPGIYTGYIYDFKKDLTKQGRLLGQYVLLGGSLNGNEYFEFYECNHVKNKSGIFMTYVEVQEYLQGFEFELLGLAKAIRQ